MLFTELIKSALNGNDEAKKALEIICNDNMLLLTNVLSEISGGGEGYSFNTLTKPMYESTEDTPIIGYTNSIILLDDGRDESFEFEFDENHKLFTSNLTIELINKLYPVE